MSHYCTSAASDCKWRGEEEPKTVIETREWEPVTDSRCRDWPVLKVQDAAARQAAWIEGKELTRRRSGHGKMGQRTEEMRSDLQELE